MSNTTNQSREFDDEDEPINAPHTDESAKLADPVKITNTLAIRIIDGSYRNAHITDAVFEIGDIKQPFDVYDGKLRVQVKCTWYGWKPKKSEIHISLGKKWELVNPYDGLVCKNFVGSK